LGQPVAVGALGNSHAPISCAPGKNRFSFGQEGSSRVHANARRGREESGARCSGVLSAKPSMEAHMAYVGPRELTATCVQKNGRLNFCFACVRWSAPNSVRSDECRTLTRRPLQKGGWDFSRTDLGRRRPRTFANAGFFRTYVPRMWGRAGRARVSSRWNEPGPVGRNRHNELTEARSNDPPPRA